MKSFLFLLLLFSFGAAAQNKTYKAKYLYYHTTDGEHSPLGKVVVVAYDAFFQTYKVSYINSSNEKSFRIFKKYGSKDINVKNGEFAWTEIIDEVKQNKKLIIKNGNYASYIIEDIISVE